MGELNEVSHKSLQEYFCDVVNNSLDLLLNADLSTMSRKITDSETNAIFNDSNKSYRLIACVNNENCNAILTIKIYWPELSKELFKKEYVSLDVTIKGKEVICEADSDFFGDMLYCSVLESYSRIDYWRQIIEKINNGLV